MKIFDCLRKKEKCAVCKETNAIVRIMHGFNFIPCCEGCKDNLYMSIKLENFTNPSKPHIGKARRTGSRGPG